MQTRRSRIPRAISAAIAAARSQGLRADRALVLNDSNKLTLRVLPADVVARVGPDTQPIAAFELDLARRLVAAGCAVVGPDPRTDAQVQIRDGFEISLWAHLPTDSPEALEPAAYADALVRLHAGMRTLDVPTPRFTDRVASAIALVEDPSRTPELPSADRALLRTTLLTLADAVGGTGREQLLHGEPHPGNVLSGTDGPMFIDLETCCRGPVEFDLAHAPTEVAPHYPGLDATVLGQSRLLTLAMVTTWRWDREDQLPGGRHLGAQWMRELREGLAGARGGR